jgi:AI-2E family transporter
MTVSPSPGLILPEQHAPGPVGSAPEHPPRTSLHQDPAPVRVVAGHEPGLWGSVPWRTIVATIGLVLATCLVGITLYAGSKIVTLVIVAVADLIPLVGATMGSIVAVFAAFLVSPTAGFVSAGLFIAYQQFENAVLQVQILSRTVHVNPLMVLVSVLLGVELMGIVGALLAVPAAGALSVIVKELWRQRPANADELILVTRDPHAEPLTTDLRRWYAPSKKRTDPSPTDKRTDNQAD